MLTKPPSVEIVCQGEPMEMGFAQGVGARKKIVAARQALASLEAFRLQQPRWLPYRMYRWLAGRHASRFVGGLALHCPTTRQRLEGIAQGANVGLNAICLFNALEPLLSSVGGCTACPGACSAVAMRGCRSATGEPVLARNFDYLPLVQPYYLVRGSRPRRKLRALEFTSAPLAGAVDGMNERGLCIAYNYGYTIDTPPTSAAPISIIISEALERCGTVMEAADWITSQPRWGGALLMLCDESGDIASLELSNTRSYLRRPDSGEDILFHTNAFSGAHMRKVQAPDGAVYTNGAPTPLRGRRLHESSELRDQRFRELLGETNAFSADELGALMADHGPTGTPDDNTPCVHGSYWQTTACLQFLPQRRRMRVAYDAACQARYVELEL